MAGFFLKLCSFYFILFFHFIFLKYLWVTNFHKTKKGIRSRKIWRKYTELWSKLFCSGRVWVFFLPLYFSIVYKVAHLSDLGLALIMSSWLFIVLFARMGPTDTPSPGSVFQPYCDIYQLLMWLLKLSSFPARQSPLWEQRLCLSLFTAKVSYSNTTQ